MTDVAHRIAAKVVFSTGSTCWFWGGAIMANGYGAVRKDGKTALAHRASYEVFVGPIPAGLDLDHLCRNRACVNPNHLEPVTRQTNLRRGATTRTAINANKTHCLRGHPYNSENTIVWNDRGWRRCRQCQRLRDNQRKSKNG